MYLLYHALTNLSRLNSKIFQNFVAFFLALNCIADTCRNQWRYNERAPATKSYYNFHTLRLLNSISLNIAKKETKCIFTIVCFELNKTICYLNISASLEPINTSIFKNFYCYTFLPLSLTFLYYSILSIVCQCLKNIFYNIFTFRTSKILHKVLSNRWQLILYATSRTNAMIVFHKHWNKSINNQDCKNYTNKIFSFFSIYFIFFTSFLYYILAILFAKGHS